MTRKRRAKRSAKLTIKSLTDPAETEWHKELVQILRHAGHGGFFFHVANERKASYGGHAHFKAMGVEAGVADLILLPREPGAPTCALELKRKGGKPSEKQVKWMERARARGWQVTVVDTLQKALDQLRAWGYTI